MNIPLYTLAYTILVSLSQYMQTCISHTHVHVDSKMHVYHVNMTRYDYTLTPLRMLYLYM